MERKLHDQWLDDKYNNYIKQGYSFNISKFFNAISIHNERTGFYQLVEISPWTNMAQPKKHLFASALAQHLNPFTVTLSQLFWIWVGGRMDDIKKYGEWKIKGIL